MFVQKLFDNQNDVEPIVNVDMKTEDDTKEQHGNNVIIIDDQGEPVCMDI